MRYKQKMLQDTFHNLVSPSSSRHQELDLVLKMIHLQIKSTKLKPIEKERLLTILGILTEMKVKVMVEDVEEEESPEGKENQKFKFGNHKSSLKIQEE